MQSGSLSGYFAEALMVLIPMILCLTVHEYAHGFAAKRLGDNTAEAAGRLTLNPVAHADLFGTILLPLMILVANGAMAGGTLPFFGWAKPVPISPSRFNRKVGMRAGSTIVAAAGPLSNLLMALICAGILSAGAHGLFGVPEALQHMLLTMMMINIALFVFNLIPIAPLDGEKVVTGFLKPAQAIGFERFNAQFGTYVLWGIIIFARGILTIPVTLVARGVMGAVGLG